MNIDELIRQRFHVLSFESLPFKSVGCTRDDLAKFMGEIGYRIGAEIGVFRGAYSETLCHSIPDLKLKCIDPWLEFRRNSQERMEARYIRACRRLSHHDAEIIRKCSMDAVRDIPDESLDFVYIDAMHEFDPVMMDLICWAPKVRKGGMVAGHDYSPPRWFNGVMAAVDIYTQQHEIKDWYITDEEDKSYFWVRK